MRSILSAWARRLTSPVRRPPASGSQAATGALTVLAALAPTVLVAMGVSLPLSGPVATPQQPAPGSSAPAPPGSSGAPQPGVANSYRIVGCRSRGGAYRQGPPRREVAIGFDDGPWSETPAFVRMLERNRARATFFVIGRQLGGANRSMLLRELRDGDVLGDHTFTHPDLTRSGDASAQLHETIAAIRSLTGYTPCVFRPPYGAYNPAVVGAARSLGLATVLWNVDPADYTQPGSEAITRRVMAQVRPGSILISHDGGGTRSQTLAAYPAIIKALRARGYRIVTIPELLGFRPVYVPCIRLCDGIGMPRSALPRNAIVQRAR
ncbi:MAG: polysaccharide deacetylase [Solirubrobacterales bacterium]|nr:polysaccharide deacetylase [Solirubrobacterales bacterium]